MKEYQDRHLKPLVNPPITAGEWETERFKAGLRVCEECKGKLDTPDFEIRTCYECYTENFRKGH